MGHLSTGACTSRLVSSSDGRGTRLNYRSSGRLWQASQAPAAAQPGPAFAPETSRRDGGEAHQEGPEFEREIWRSSREMICYLQLRPRPWPLSPGPTSEATSSRPRHCLSFSLRSSSHISGSPSDRLSWPDQPLLASPV